MAKPLFSAGCAGELSVRWNYFLEKWIMLYNCELCNTSGVIVRLADVPWGPWSPPRIIFDPDEGYGKYIHDPKKHDKLYDPSRDRAQDKGDEYGPYQIAPYSTGVKGRYTKIYFTISTWNPYQVLQMSAIIPSEEEESNPKPYATNSADRNDIKYAYISVLLAHIARISNSDLKNSLRASTYIADHIEWAQFQSSAQLRTEIKEKFLHIISGLSSDGDKADLYNAMMTAIFRLTHDYSSTIKNSIDETNHRQWALNAIHSGHKEWLISKVEQAIDDKNFLVPSNDSMCYAYGPYDSNEFKYARVCLLVSELTRRRDADIKVDFQSDRLLNCNSYLAWARFRTLKELRQDLLNKIEQTIFKLRSADSIDNAYSQITKTILELTEKPSYRKDYSNGNECMPSLVNNNNNNNDMSKDEIIMRMSKLVDSDYFLIPIGQRSYG
jgi:hypothetical protein